MRLCLIPAAGFGKRLGSPHAKELLIDPKTGSALIDWGIEQALKQDFKVHIISRQDKAELNLYLEKKYPKSKVQIQLINESKEWPDSILKSSKFWMKHNILLLPDTRFENPQVLTELINCLTETQKIAYGVFKQEDYKSWGCIQQNSLWACEKPQDPNLVAAVKAWGLIAFENKVGEALFEKILKSTLDHQAFELPQIPNTIDMINFKDITRDWSYLESSNK